MEEAKNMTKAEKIEYIISMLEQLGMVILKDDTEETPEDDRKVDVHENKNSIS